MVSPKKLQKFLSYDPETGVLTWRRRPEHTRGDKSFNTRFAGKQAFTATDGNGYKYGSVQPLTGLRAHRVIWAIVHGKWPKFIDHINGDRTDNRLVNLREVTKAENAQNQKRRSDNTSGVLVVSWSREHGKWRARIQNGPRRMDLGLFDDLADAAAACKKAMADLGYGPNHGA